MLPSQLLPGHSFPRAPVLPVDREHPPRPDGIAPSSLRYGRRSVRPAPCDGGAEVTTSFAFPVPRHAGTSTQHGEGCCRGYSRCGIARKGKRPISS